MLTIPAYGGAFAQAPGADAPEQERAGPVLNAGFVPPDSTAGTPVRPQISRLSYDTLPSASAPQYSAQGYPPDVADRVVTVWYVKYR